MNILYNIGIQMFNILVLIVSPFNPKAAQWIRGRKSWPESLRKKIRQGEKYIWMHCASLGEFEQGRPVIEAIRERMPDHKIVLSFFSPSGYEVRKDYRHADCICYLPSDTPSNSRRFIDLVNPEFAVFVKYEFWSNYLSVLHRKGIPLYLISGIFRPGQHFFRWYGSFSRGILARFTHFFVQNEQSLELLGSLGLKNVTLAGDTRFDRVVQIAGAAKEIQQILKFRGEEMLFLAGSSWADDEAIITEYINRYPGKMKWVFAPHETDRANISRLEKLIKVKTVRFSEFTDASADSRVLIIDGIGMLSSAYRYAYMAAIGGGFGKGIHNVLEAAAWGIPVLFGPNHKRFQEAVDLLKHGGAMTFTDYSSFESILEKWTRDKDLYRNASEAAGNYVRENTGATDRIMALIAPEDINTNH
jgi:3-deoxy-D-manno-octulosonic-acid transferase